MPKTLGTGQAPTAATKNIIYNSIEHIYYIII